MSLMAQCSTQFLSEVWRKERASMEIHGLSYTIKSLPFLTCNMLWFIPEAKYYKNNVSPTKYDQLLSALAAVKERYILLRTRELTQLSVKVATFWQIFHSPERRSSRHCKEAGSELPCVGWAKRKIQPIEVPSAPGFDRQPSEACTAVYLCINTPGKSSASLLSLLAHFLAGEPPPGEWGSFWWAGSICALGDFQRCIHSSPTAAARENGAQTWIHMCVLNT